MLPRFLLLLLAASLHAQEAGTRDPVGQLAPGRYQTPTNQLLTPAGTQVELPGMRPQAIALSPDGRLLATSGKTSDLVIIDPGTGKVLQKVPFPAKPSAGAARPAPAAKPDENDETEGEAGAPASPQVKADSGAQVSITGLIFSPDGTRIYVSNVNGDVKVFAVEAGKVAPLKTLAVPDANAPKRKSEIPAGLAVAGKLLYVAGNLGNRLHEIDIETGKTARSIDIGVAPHGVALAAGKAYVACEGGRRPGPKDVTGPAGRGTKVRVDPVMHVASEGTVSVVDLKTGKVVHELLTGLHASALTASPDGRWVVCANAGSDTLSVIDTRTDAIVERIWTRQTPADLFGATPNAVAFDPSGRGLFVCNGTQNAVAVIAFDPEDKESRLLGLIPVGWFPGAIVFDTTRKQLCVANIKGTGVTTRLAGKPTDKPPKPSETGSNSKQYHGTVSLVPVPDAKALTDHTAAANINMRHGLLQAAKLPPRPGIPPRPVPERSGEPSVFRHVVYIIKENRTYDQMLGDVQTGNGDPKLCIFGEKFTPNQHKLVREFVLLDNTYCSGIQSADGHQWTGSAITTDYVERQHAGWPRSYPNLKSEESLDALAYAPTGFIWDLAVKHKIHIRNYGEASLSTSGWADKTRRSKPKWLDYLRDFEAGTQLTKLGCKPGIPSLEKITKTDTVGWDMQVPDIMKAAKFIEELQASEKSGTPFPQLSILFLPNDHTSGTGAGVPTPGAYMADNDLAMGRVVEALSKSKIWPQTVVFAIEDDPQNGWDHVSGYRTTCYVASAYSRGRGTVSTQYNQTSVLRTIELILGLPPMHLLDATATPMSDCFGNKMDLTPFLSVANTHPLDEMNPEKKRADAQLEKDAVVSAALPLGEPDKCDEDTLNRILWRAMRGTSEPYPEWAVAKVEDDDDE